jgi:heme/copper-type cytochrome/quinol oxidase subunit 4
MNSPDAKKGGAGIMLFTIILEFIVAVGLAILIYRTAPTGGWISGLKIGALTGFCFSGIAVWISFMYQMKPKSLIAVDVGYHVVGQIIAAIIICMWS